MLVIENFHPFQLPYVLEQWKLNLMQMNMNLFDFCQIKLHFVWNLLWTPILRWVS